MANEFVTRRGLVSLGGITFPYVSVTGTYTITSDDYLIDCTSGTFNVTLPTAIGVAGKIYVLKNSGSGTITLNTTLSQNIDDSSSVTLTQNQAISVQSNGVGWIITSTDSEIVAGKGLTSSGGTLDVLLGSNSGLTFSGDNITIQFNPDALEVNASNQVSLKEIILGNRTFSDEVTFNGTNSFFNGGIGQGINTAINGFYGLASGDNTVVDGYAAAGFGEGGLAQGTYSFVAGEGTVAYNQSQIALGKYNTFTNSNDLLVIGNGTDDSNRSDLAKFATNSIIFNSTLQVNALDIASVSVTSQERRIYWDQKNRTIAVGLAGGNVNMQIGQEEFYLVSNQTGATLSNAKVVGVVGVSASGDAISAGYFLADGNTPSDSILGVVTNDISPFDKGFVTEFGLVRGVDTTGSEYGETWLEGDTLYVSPTSPGGLTKNKPESPDIAILMGIVISATSSGSIFVRPTFFGRIQDLDNVEFYGVTPSAEASLQFSSTASVWTWREYSYGAYAAGVVSGATAWSQSNNGTITLPTVEVALYDNENYVPPLKIYTVAGTVSGTGTTPALVNEDTNYIYIDYNNGSPKWFLDQDGTAINNSNVVRYMTVYRAGNFIHNLEFGDMGAGLVEKLNARIIQTDRFARESGLAIGLSGSSGILTLSEGVAWNGPYRQELAALNSADDFLFKNYHVGGVWTYSVATPFTFATASDLINNEFYDDGTDRVTASASKYLVNWYYRGQEINDHLYEVLGNTQYDTFGEAELAGEPSIPELVQSHAILIGRVIVQVGTFSGVAQTSFGTTFQSSSVTSHNDLTGIQGGVAGEYYHLSQTQFDNLVLENVNNNFTVNQTINGYELKTETWTQSNILITGTNSVEGSGFTFNDNLTSSNTIWSSQKTADYIDRPTIDGNKTFSGDLLIQGTLSVLDSFTAGDEFTVNTVSNFNGDLLPTLDATWNLGNSSLQWDSLYVASQSVYIGGVTMSSDSDAINIQRINFGTEAEPIILSGNLGELLLNGRTFSEINMNVIRVAQSGGQFTSVKAAMESITGASSSNPFVISVCAGTYLEDPFTVKSHVAILGESSQSTIMQTTDPNVNFLTCQDQCFISDIQITGATGTSASAVFYSSSTTVASQAIVYVENVRFGSNWNHATVKPIGSGNIAMQLTNVKYGAQPFTLGFYATSNGTGVCRMLLRNVTTTAGGIQSTTGLVFAKTDQPNCTIIANLVGLTKVGSGPAQGIGFQAENGGLLRINVANLQRFEKAIYIPSGGSAPTIDAVGLNFENCTTDVEILNSSTLGKIDGISDYTKTIIPLNAPIYIVGKDQRRITVAKKGGDFSSIKSAVESLSGTSETNRYVIEVGPGEFYEEEIDLSSKPYVSIVGSNIQTTQIFASASNQNLFKMGIFNELSFLSLNNVGDGTGTWAAILADDSGDFSQAHKLSFYNCDIGIKILSSTQDTLFYGEYVDFNGTFSQAVCVDSQSSGFLAFANIENFYTFPGVTGSMAGCVYNETAELNVAVATLEGLGDDVAFYVENGSTLKVSSIDITGYETGLWIPNIGTASTFNFSSVVMDDSVSVPLKVKQPNVTGFFQGSLFNHNLIDNDSPDVYWQFLDTFDGELNITRKASVTFADGTTTDLTTLVFETGPMGVISGGLISISSGLTVSVSSGYGYLETTTDSHKRIDWLTSTLQLPDSSSEYIYINENEILTYSTSLPSIENNIVLGRVVTVNGQVLFIDNTRVDVKHADNKLNLFNRKAIGAIYESGSLVTQGVGSYSIDVSGGSYWFGEANFTPTGGATVSFEQFYRDGSGGWIITTTNSVTHQYDAGSGSLITMSASYYTKHTLYVVGESVDEKYLMVVGQNQYLNLIDAEDAPLPTPPTYFEDGVAAISSIYVQEGGSSILQIEDIRPVLGFKSSGVNATSDHGNLLGLSDDDHQQYLLVSGSRAMTGNLLMGSNSISGVLTVNGVTVESHASRHLPNGADPLATGVPVTIGTVSSEGTANAFARQDHVHAHGVQSDGALHAVATTTVNGFMSAVDKVTFDAIPATYVNVSGDTMTGVLTMSSNKITDLATGSNNLDATNYGQVVKLGAFDNLIYVSDYTDFGASVSGVYTLGDNKTYFVTETIDLLGGRLVGGQNTTILGGSSENCRIKSTGLTSGVPLLTSSYSIPIRAVTLEANTVFNLDAGSPSTAQAIDWFGVNVSSPDMGTISNYSNFIANDCAFLDSAGLVFDGSMGTIGFSQTLFTNFLNDTVITLPSTLTVTRRFRVIYSSFVVTGTGTGINASTVATIPNESYILDTINFSGGGNYVTGITATNSNNSLFINCVGIQNTSTNGYMYYSNNVTATTVGVGNQNVWFKAAGTSTALDSNSKFDHTSNRLTYTGAFNQLFLVTCSANVFTTANNQTLTIGIAENSNLFGATVSQMSVRCPTANVPTAVQTQLVVELTTNDFVELWVRNETGTGNITVQDMNFVVSKLGN